MQTQMRRDDIMVRCGGGRGGSGVEVMAKQCMFIKFCSRCCEPVQGISSSAPWLR